jgi:NADPH2:quinone reductase
MKISCVRVRQLGGPEQLEWTEAELGPPGPGEVQLQHHAIGLNFIDVYHRTGLYPQPLPFVPGQEAAGVVTALGPGVTSLKVGQRVAYAPLGGAYATFRNAPADRLLALPDEVDDATAASIMLKGMTAEFLVRRCYPAGPRDTVLVHAAAGGVGQLLVPWARHLGATVIATVGSEAKVPIAQAAGANHVLLQGADLAARVKALTPGGRGVTVVYDSVGKDTVPQSLEALAPRGMLVAFGQSSGKPAPLELGTLGPKSLYVTRASLFAYTASRDDLELSARSLFEVVRAGVVKVGKPTTFALRDVAAAHRALEARQTTGSVVLLPG